MTTNDIYIYTGAFATNVKFKRTARPTAYKQLTANHDRQFFLAGANVASACFHNNQYLATFPSSLNLLNADYNEPKTKETLKKIYNQATFYLKPELGRYIVWYVEVV